MARKRAARAGGSRSFGDDMENLLSGMGNPDKDKFTGTQYVFTPMARGQLEAAYRGDWIARKIVDIPAQDATREWRTWQADKGDINKITDLEEELGLQSKVKQAMQRARLYGGAAIVMGVDQGKDMSEPLDVERLKVGALKFLHVMSRNVITAGEVQWDLNEPFYGEPKSYTTARGSVSTIHPSRVIRLVGNPYPDDSVSNGDAWGDSILNAVNQAIVAANIVSQSTAQLVQETKLDVIRVPNLVENLGNADYEARFKKRFGLANVAKSVYSTLVIDKEEEWQRINANFSGLPDMLKMYLLIASGAADIPATRMLGQSPAGLSSTGESDLRNYYDNIADDQDTDLRSALDRLDEVLVRSALGSKPDGLFYEWNSLWQLDAVQKADVAQKKSAAHKIDVDAALIPSEILRDARINQLIEDGTYPGLEQIVDDFGEMEALDVPPGQEQTPPTDNPPPAPGATPPQPPGPSAQKNAAATATAGNKQAADAIAKRARVSALDSTPRSLYVRRDVVNPEAIVSWAKAQGLDGIATDLHVTIAYSTAAVDWTKAGEAWGQDDKGRVTVLPGGPRSVERFGPTGDTIVLEFASSALSYRHCQIREATGASWDYPDYCPHVSITASAPATMDVSKIEPYRGEIVLGPEIFEEVNSTSDSENNASRFVWIAGDLEVE